MDAVQSVTVMLKGVFTLSWFHGSTALRAFVRQTSLLSVTRLFPSSGVPENGEFGLIVSKRGAEQQHSEIRM